MKKRIRQLLLHQDHMAFQSIVPVVVIIVLLAGVLTALLLNTAGLKERLRQNTVSYADDVSAQLASNISSRMQMREIYISNLADTLSRMPESLLTEELLDRKAEYIGKITDDMYAALDELNANLEEKMRANGFEESEIESAKLSFHDVVIVASLVEKETAKTSESASDCVGHL